MRKPWPAWISMPSRPASRLRRAAAAKAATISAIMPADIGIGTTPVCGSGIAEADHGSAPVAAEAPWCDSIWKTTFSAPWIASASARMPGTGSSRQIGIAPPVLGWIWVSAATSRPTPPRARAA
jgi:hypothetical protein